MRTSRWQPFTPVYNPLQQFQNEINRLFDNWGSDRPNGATGLPPVNVWEEGDQLVVETELPGLDLSGLELYVNGGNQLTLIGERKPPTV